MRAKLNRTLIAITFFCAATLAADASVIERQVSMREVSIKTASGVLWSTLALAGEAPGSPAAIIIPGSGPTNRDGNGPGIQPNTLKLLAENLAGRGIASIRIDKRGVGASRPAMRSEVDLRFQTYADDAKAWATELRAQTGAQCVWLIGHSEGALVAEVAARENGGICGLVLVAGAGRKAGDILRQQLAAALPDPLKQEAYADLAELEAGRAVAASPQLMALFRPSVQPYMMSWLPLDPAAILAGLKQPVLIIQGETDIQVSVEDARLLARARPDAELAILPGVNHVLKPAPADRAANIATYSDPNLPLAPGVGETIADFINKNGGLR
ncbi:MAG: alpha/beta hydrolase [Xanthobacteraceae bacterium]